MLKLLQLYWLIARRKLGPEDVPVSPFLLQMTILVYALLQLPLLWRQSGITPGALFSIVADVLILSGFVWVLLRMTSKSERYIQTVTAFFGTGCIVTLVALPITFLYLNTPEDSEQILFLYFALLGVIIWSVTINAHIFSRAVSRTMAEGIVLSLFYFVINFQVLEAIPG